MPMFLGLLWPFLQFARQGQTPDAEEGVRVTRALKKGPELCARPRSAFTTASTAVGLIQD